MKLSICPTPIGNLGDITLRVLETLKNADVIAAEDSRHTRKLLTHYQIPTRLMRYDDHHSEAGLDEVMTLLASGAHVALVSDAGMPLISDPGTRLVQRCLEAGIEVEVLPGPTALVNAWVLSGFTGESFSFYGFLPRKTKELQRRLAEIKPRQEVAIIYEAPHRILKTLEAIYEVFGDRQVVLARELTKLYEEVLRLSCSELIAELEARPRKGEMVLLIEGAKDQPSEVSIEAELRELIDIGMSKNDAVKAVAQARGIPRRKVYQRAIDL